MCHLLVQNCFLHQRYQSVPHCRLTVCQLFPQGSDHQQRIDSHYQHLVHQYCAQSFHQHCFLFFSHPYHHARSAHLLVFQFPLQRTNLTSVNQPEPHTEAG
uniref:Uncharacterized protein n=1 Tax=Cacopsylla melanoneura TaxID=428564 RepID=A0A8D9AJX7_9HEMI